MKEQDHRNTQENLTEQKQEENMGILGWMNPEDYAFDAMLRMERFQIRLMLEYLEGETETALAVSLKANPKVAWVFEHKCPEMAEKVRALIAGASEGLAPEQVRAAEVYVLGAFEDFVIYTTPEVMEEKCDFIYGWKKERLFELCDLEGKTVLDVGSGTGRLAFAAAEKAAFVVASEPVDSLREFMRDEIARKHIHHYRSLAG